MSPRKFCSLGFIHYYHRFRLVWKMGCSWDKRSVCAQICRLYRMTLRATRKSPRYFMTLWQGQYTVLGAKFCEKSYQWRYVFLALTYRYVVAYRNGLVYFFVCSSICLSCFWFLCIPMQIVNQIDFNFGRCIHFGNLPLSAWWCQSITLTHLYLSSKILCGIHLNNFNHKKWSWTESATFVGRLHFSNYYNISQRPMS